MKSELELLRTLAEAEEDVVNGRVSVTLSGISAFVTLLVGLWKC